MVLVWNLTASNQTCNPPAIIEVASLLSTPPPPPGLWGPVIYLHWQHLQINLCSPCSVAKAIVSYPPSASGLIHPSTPPQAAASDLLTGSVQKPAELGRWGGGGNLDVKVVCLCRCLRRFQQSQTHVRIPVWAYRPLARVGACLQKLQGGHVACVYIHSPQWVITGLHYRKRESGEQRSKGSQSRC